MLVILMASHVAEVCAEEWQAGTARVAITPQTPMRLAGYADRTGLSRGKRHDLWAKAIVLKTDGGQYAVLVTLDLIGIDRTFSQRTCRAIQRRYQIPRSAVVLATSHTHTGPIVGRVLAPMFNLSANDNERVDEYTDWVADRALQAVTEAWRGLAPVTLEFGIGEAAFAVNRRNNPEESVVARRNSTQLVGPVDHDVPVLAVRDIEGTLRALVCGYACHATVLNDDLWSGDWPGMALLELEERHPTAMALFCAGCGADQNPLPRRSVVLAGLYGEQLADAVDRVLDGPMKKVTPALSTAYEETALSYDQLPTRAELTQQAMDDGVTARRARYLLDEWKTNGGLKSSYPYPVQVWRLGSNISWIFLGGEVVVDYSLRLKLELGRKTTWVTAYANDVMAYIPSRRVLLEGGYEGGGSMPYYGLPSRWDGNVELRIADSVRRLHAMTAEIGQTRPIEK